MDGVNRKQLENFDEQTLLDFLKNTHITLRELDLYADGKGSEPMKARVKAHIKNCKSCKTEVETLEEYRYGICGKELADWRNKEKTPRIILQPRSEPIKEIVDTFLGWLSPASLALPAFAASLGNWKEEELEQGASYIRRELGDGRLEFRFMVPLGVWKAPVIQLEDNLGWVKEIKLEQGPFTRYGSIIMTIEERERFKDPNQISVRVVEK
jgi:hypothetical protein